MFQSPKLYLAMNLYCGTSQKLLLKPNYPYTRNSRLSQPLYPEDSGSVSNTVRVDVEHLDRLNYLIGIDQPKPPVSQDEKLQARIQNYYLSWLSINNCSANCRIGLTL
jgi:hypothetical protein